MTPSTKIVLVTCCGCKRYTDWPAMSMRREVIVPLYTRSIPSLVADPQPLLPTKSMPVRYFEATGKYEVSPDGQQTWAVYQEIYEHRA